ncbi:glycosyltransferase family 4 protein [Bipolaris oryzae ATCC 44560]|uniref:Glycosyltransferase family 4 protein n=1 Tax=Bipolaris oryzae ATCC 44560 TaxID=930090 RepID=W6ZFZ4_COCMI|nr:glycosyltransferase family 4 protein [Bipolaris oryzae ATCC 44560]EUC50732.1 glycosyltransferase family 4 protein [Bipolaris oryzae ATCC 44560]
MLYQSPVHSSSSSALSSSTVSDTSTSGPSLFPMRVFLVQTARGLFSSSGGYKANICLLRYLASRGHSVRQLCYSYHGEVEMYTQIIAKGGGRDMNLHKRLLHLRGENNAAGTDVTVHEFVMDDGVQIVALDSDEFDAAFGGKKNIHKAMTRETADLIETGTTSARLQDFVSFLQQEITMFMPTHIISNDGLSMQATSALQMPSLSVCRVGIVHTAEQLPFGPFAGGLPGHASSPGESKLLQNLDGIWSVSDAIKKYALEHGRLRTSFFVHHPWTYLEETSHRIPAHLHNWDKKFVCMINPCVVKGSPIFIDIAKACPQHDFLVYKSWGFDDVIGKRMEELPNITIRPACTNMEEAWQDIKLLLVPSLWLEAWGIVLVEAHLRGIPVISSSSGALPEAMLGLDHIVPVNPINGDRDEEGAYIVPPQDIRPWVKTVNRLMNNRSEYENLSIAVREKTVQWLKDMDEMALENWLAHLAIDSNGYRTDR